MIKSQHSRRFEELLRERRASLVESLIALPNERTSGWIHGIDEALQISEQADRELSGEQ